MIIAIPVMEKNGMNSKVSTHFGHAPYFAYANVEDGKVESVQFEQNPFNANHEMGSVPNFLIQKGIDVLIVANMGPAAYELFNSNGIKVYNGIEETLDEVIMAYLKDELRERTREDKDLAKGKDDCDHHEHR